MRRVAFLVIFACFASPAAHGRQVGGGLDGGVAPPVEASSGPKTRLYVRTIPSGAQVTLDGKPLGISNGLFLVPAGKARVAVGFGGHESDVQEVEIAGGKITRVEFQLGADVVGREEQGLGGRGMGGGGMGDGGMGDGGMSPEIFFLGNLRSTRKHAQPPAPLTPIDHLLAKSVDLSISDASLQDLAHAIEKAVGCDVSIEQRPLQQAGIDLDGLLLTTQSHGVPLARFLDRVLPSYGLGWTAQDGGIQITSLEAASENLFTHIHDVSDLCAGADSLQTLENLVIFSIDCRTWEVCGGDGASSMDLAPDTAALVVRQTLAVQRRIAGFLDGLRKLKAQPAAERQTLSAEGWWSDSERTVAIRAALARPVKGKVEFTKKSLPEVAEILTEASGVPVLVDKQACDDAPIVLDDHRLSFTGRDLPLGRLLDRMLRDVALAFVVDDDQLVITTVPAAAERVSVAIYPVDRFLAKRRDLKGIATTLKATVAESTWDVMGGYGQVFAVGGDAPCLVVVQTTAGHRAVAEFLGSLK